MPARNAYEMRNRFRFSPRRSNLPGALTRFAIAGVTPHPASEPTSVGYTVACEAVFILHELQGDPDGE
jgi:hypothetical protein